MLRYGLAGAIQTAEAPANRAAGSRPISSVDTHSKLSPRSASAAFVAVWVTWAGRKSPTTAISVVSFIAYPLSAAAWRPSAVCSWLRERTHHHPLVERAQHLVDPRAGPDGEERRLLQRL